MRSEPFPFSVAKRLNDDVHVQQKTIFGVTNAEQASSGPRMYPCARSKGLELHFI